MSDRDVVINELVEHIESALAVDSDYVCVRTDLLQTVVGLLKKHGDEIEQLNRFVNGFSRDAVRVVRCKDCEHGSLYCTEDVCGETLIECNRPDLGDVIEIHGWKWYCADGEVKK